MAENRSERRALASQARRNKPEPEKPRAARTYRLTHIIGGHLLSFYAYAFPRLSMAHQFLLNFVLGAVIGAGFILLVTVFLFGK